MRNKIFIWIIGILLLCSFVNADGTYYITNDTALNQGSAGTNYASTSPLYIQSTTGTSNWWTMAVIDLTNVSETIAYANLSYYVSDLTPTMNSIANVTGYYCNGTPDIQAITWTNRGTYIDANCEKIPFIGLNAGGKNLTDETYVSWDITKGFSKYTSSKVFTILFNMSSPTNGNYLEVQSNETASPSTKRPKLTYIGGTIPSYNQLVLTFMNQTPADITTINALNTINITYNISSNNKTDMVINTSTVFLYYKTNNSFTNCYEYINGTKSICDYNNKTQLNNVSDIFRFILGDNEIYPGTYNLPHNDFMSEIHGKESLTNQNNIIGIQLQNVSSLTRYNLFEVMANTSGNNILNVFYCNSSYTSGNLGASSNCANIGFIEPNNNFNHTHNLSKHQIIPFTINNGLVSGVAVSSISYFMLQMPTLGNWNIWNISNISRPGVWLESNNNGNSYINLSTTPDAHLHQYNGTEYFYNYVCAKSNGSNLNNCSTIRSELIDLEIVTPTPPKIIIPNSSNYNTQINITYLNTTTPLISTKINYFNISLLNSDITTNKTITTNNSLNLSYLWYVDVYPGSYFIKVCVIDNITQAGCSISDMFNISIGANISVIDFKNNATIWNYTINLTYLATGEQYYLNVTNGLSLFSVPQAGAYNIYVDSDSYSFNTQNITLNTSLFQQFSIYLYPLNSVLFNIYDENTSLLLTQNATVSFYNAVLGQTDYTAQNGVLLLENITSEVYLITVSSGGYTPRTYTLTVGNNTYQILNVYLSTSSSTTILNIKDEDTLATLDNVLVTMYKNINGSWIAIESKYSDVTGRAQFNYIPLTNYKFFLSRSDYVDYIFYLTPILFPNYDVLMKKATTINISQDLDDISLMYAPTSFESNNITTFNFIIQSPKGKLISYGYNISYPGGSNIAGGNNAIGGQLSSSVNITGALITDRVFLVYYYETTTSNGLRNFSAYFPINIAYANNTMMSNNYTTYGLTVFERILIATVIIIFIVGIASLVGQLIPGLVLGLLSYGYLSFIGFIPLWSILLSFFIGFMVIQWRNG